MRSMVLAALLCGLLGGLPASAAPTFGESAYRSDRVEFGYDFARDYEDGPQVFRGKFNGKCYDDGIYYQDSSSFVLCSHGNSYTMPCSPGTKNDQFAYYEKHIGKNNEDVQLCNVNLVDTGYGQGFSQEGAYGAYQAPAAAELAYPPYKVTSGESYGGKASYNNKNTNKKSNNNNYRYEDEADSSYQGYGRNHDNQRERDSYSSSYDQDSAASYGGYRSRDYQWQA